MMSYRRDSVIAQRFAERRRSEDAAPRLCDEVPDLLSLRLDIVERAGALEIRHVRHVVVDRAPALFIVCCNDTQCSNGVHDLTETVMRALRARLTTFHGDDDCNGSISGLPPSPCKRVLHLDAVAAYA